MMSVTESVTDIVEVCAVLQCLGFTVKSLDTNDVNLSQDGGIKTVVINCQSSGLNVVLENGSPSCSCPASEQQNSGFWQVSGMAGGKLHDKESGSTILRSIPKLHRDHLSKELQDMIRKIKTLSELADRSETRINKSASMVELAKDKSGSLVDLSKEINKSASVLELATPEKRHQLLKVETPTRYRSLDTLTSVKDDVGLLGQKMLAPCGGSGGNLDLRVKCHRQNTYTLRSGPGVERRRNKTSSPIQDPAPSLLDRLLEAEKDAESLRSKLAAVIKEFTEDGQDESSMSSMLDVSKISVLKLTETSKAQFASSSPNLSGLSTARDDFPKSKLRRYDSASSSNLRLRPTPDKDSKSKLKRISPRLFNFKKENAGTKDKTVDGKGSRLQNLFRPKIVTPVRPRPGHEASPVPSSSTKKKYSHIKSTIPKPTPKKE